MGRGRLAQVARHSAEEGLYPQKQVSCRDTVEVLTGALEAGSKGGRAVVRPEQPGLHMRDDSQLDGLDREAYRGKGSSSEMSFEFILQASLVV